MRQDVGRDMADIRAKTSDLAEKRVAAEDKLSRIDTCWTVGCRNQRQDSLEFAERPTKKDVGLLECTPADSMLAAIAA